MIESPLHTFEPTGFTLCTSAVCPLGLALLAIGTLSFLLLRRKIDRNYRSLLILGTGLAFLILTSMGIATYFLGERVGTVRIYSDWLDTPYGKILFSELEDVVIHVDQKNSPLTPDMTTSSKKRLLLILKDQRTYFFSAERYPIQEMVEVMRGRLENFRESENEKGWD